MAGSSYPGEQQQPQRLASVGIVSLTVCSQPSFDHHVAPIKHLYNPNSRCSGLPPEQRLIGTKLDFMIDGKDWRLANGEMGWPATWADIDYVVEARATFKSS
jgi:hypothetical protein